MKRFLYFVIGFCSVLCVASAFTGVVHEFLLGSLNPDQLTGTVVPMKSLHTPIRYYTEAGVIVGQIAFSFFFISIAVGWLVALVLKFGFSAGSLRKIFIESGREFGRILWKR